MTHATEIVVLLLRGGHVLFLLLLSTLLLGCGSVSLRDMIYEDDDSTTIHTTNPVFHKYLDKLPIRTKTPVIFKTKKGNTAAVCAIRTDGYREIQVDPRYWSKYGDSDRLELLAHEIGHCDYDLPHNNNKMGNGCPLSVMHDTVFGDPCFSDYFDFYMTEFR